MARKKANKAKFQPAATTPESDNQQPAPLSSVESILDEDISEYPEVHQNEYLATQAIYPDEFVRIRGRKDAWKNHENLAFLVRLTSLENADFFVKLDFEFPREYPKVPLKVKVLQVEPDVAKIRLNLEDIIKTVTKSQVGNECVHEVTGAVDELLNRSAVSKAEKANPFSLEEERAKKENAAKLAEQQVQAQIQRTQQEAEAKGRQQLVSQLSTERKKRENIKHKKMELIPKYFELDFERDLFLKDVITGRRHKFHKVTSYQQVLQRSDKTNRLVVPIMPGVDSITGYNLLLKEINLRKDLIVPDEMQSTMTRVENLLQKSCELDNESLVDIVGYKLLYPAKDEGRDSYKLYVLSSWSDAGSLGQLVNFAGSLPPEKVREFARQVLQGLWYYETNNFVHPAVHSYNVILFMISGQSIPSLKIADGYGVALRDLVDKARDKSASVTKSLDPPRLWTAPELSDPSIGRSIATAMWDYGRIMLEMTLGQSIYDKFTSPKDCLRKTSLDTNFSDILHRLFREDPSKRPTADSLRSSSFFSDHGPLLFVTDTQSRSTRGAQSAPSKWEEEWENLGRIGKGGGGSVFRSRKLTDQVVYAVKHIKIHSAQQYEQDRSEILNLARLQHPSIVRYYDAWAEADPSDDIDDDESDQPFTQSIFHPIPSTEGENDEMVDELAANFSKYEGVSKLDMPPPTISEAHRRRRLPSSPRPLPPRFEQTNTSLPRGMDEDDDSDEDDEESEAAYDDDDDYDNAYARGDAHIDSNDLKDELPESPDAARHGDVFYSDSQVVDDDSGFGGVGIDQSKSMAALPPQPPRRRRSTFEKGTLYIQMEFCEGQSLKKLIGPALCNDVNQVWQLLRGVLVGLAYIHGENIAHRDLKPDNIFLGSENVPKIGDFGLATANAARKAGSEVGTPHYIAPELLKGKEITDMSKVDMFSLGIMLFEMTFPMTTHTERHMTLIDLNEGPSNMPQKRYESPEYKDFGDIIRQLVSHNPEERPSASALLESGKIPEPIEQGKLERHVTWMVHNEPTKLSAMLPKGRVTELQDLAWENVRTDGQEIDQPELLRSIVKECFEATFRKHGAVGTSRQVLLPKTAEGSDTSVTMFNKALMPVQLRKDLTIPYARSIAKDKPRFAKAFCFGDVYESRQDQDKAEPKSNPRANFDFVSYKASDIALKEASTIYVIQDVLSQFSPLSSLPWVVFINHLDLLDLILDHCGIRQEDWLKVKDLLSRIHYGRSSEKQRIQQWKAFEKALRSKHNIADTSVAELGKFANIKGEAKAVREALRTVFRKNSTKISQAMGLLSRLEEVITYLDRLEFSLKVVIAPVSNSDAHLYAGSIVFECINEESGRSLATGGRYDSLIQHHARGSNDPFPRAVGFSVNVASVAHMLADASSNDKGKGKASKVVPSSSSSGAFAASSAPVPSRVDVLVTSFDSELLTTRCLDVLRGLWRAGISAELTEEVETMEQLAELHGSDGPYWLVIVRVVVNDEVVVKVRSPAGDEEVVEMEALAGWLRVEVRREKKGGK